MARMRNRFNGAATFALRKSEGGARGTNDAGLLQWGRNFCVAEMGYFLGTGENYQAASMGPQLLRCGNWIDHRRSIRINALQWGRNFCVAEISTNLGRRDAADVLQWGRNFCVAEI